MQRLSLYCTIVTYNNLIKKKNSYLSQFISNSSTDDFHKWYSVMMLLIPYVNNLFYVIKCALTCSICVIFYYYNKYNQTRQWQYHNLLFMIYLFLKMWRVLIIKKKTKKRKHKRKIKKKLVKLHTKKERKNSMDIIENDENTRKLWITIYSCGKMYDLTSKWT